MKFTYKRLQTLADKLNVLTNSPTTARDATGARIGHFYISCAYGGYELQRIVNNGGAANDYFNTGHTTAKELDRAICAFMDGIEFAKA